MAKTNGTVVKALLAFIGAAILAVGGYVVASKVDKEVYQQHVVHNEQKHLDIKEKQTGQFELVQQSLSNIERKLGIYEPDPD